jgi:hypothetical protein
VELAEYTVQYIGVDPFHSATVYFCTTLRGVLKGFIH